MHSDVVIVGAGSAGSVLAGRVSADSGCHVTVVEAGPDVTGPAVAAMVADGSVLPIGAASPLVARYQTSLTERPRRIAQIMRGTVVGGSGAVNGGYFCRGLPRDFDGWHLSGWSWTDVLPHFRAIERDMDFSGPSHGRDGPIPVQRTRQFSAGTGEFVENAYGAGYPWIADLNGDANSPPGVGAVPLNIADGVRAGPGTAFLRPALQRPNVRLLANTRVWRIRTSAGRAVGVQAVGPDGDVLLTAGRIVLCAGAIESAHLLMLSGVGDESALNKAGIPVVSPSPVGLRCADHPEWVMPSTWTTVPGRPVLEAILSTGEDIEIRPYTGGFIAMTGDGANGRPDWPHVGVALMQPRARGRLRLVSADPDVALRVEHRYDTEPQDVDALRRGCDLARQLCCRPDQLADPVWSTSQHLCGSAPMGPDGDDGAVLDAQCRVRGVDGLWVVDGSALPVITSRGPHASIVMLAHRAAEFVVA